MSSPHHKDSDTVLKTNRIYENRDYNNYAFQQTQFEALVMLQTFASKRTMQIYGFCGTSILIEPGDEIQDKIIPNNWKWVGQKDLDKKQEHDVQPQNNLTLTEKLDIALAMAESLALMHGNEEGVIISHDVGFDQWLRSKRDGLVKLNDFNKARPLKWNHEQNKYCKIWSYQSDSYRSPEEGRFNTQLKRRRYFDLFLY